MWVTDAGQGSLFYTGQNHNFVSNVFTLSSPQDIIYYYTWSERNKIYQNIGMKREKPQGGTAEERSVFKDRETCNRCRVGTFMKNMDVHTTSSLIMESWKEQELHMSNCYDSFTCIVNPNATCSTQQVFFVFFLLAFPAFSQFFGMACGTFLLIPSPTDLLSLLFISPGFKDDQSCINFHWILN